MSDAAKRNSDTARRDRFGRKPEPPGRPAGGPKVPETNFEDFMRHAVIFPKFAGCATGLPL